MIKQNSLIISGDCGSIDANLLEEAIDVCLQTMGLSSNNKLSLVFCNPDEMMNINKRYRGVDKTTDVLSFPADLGQGLYKSSEAGEIYLGEILVDIKYIAEQTNSSDMNKEIIAVLIHGFLHLLGFDHLNSTQKEKMQKMETIIMNKIRQI